MNWNEHSDLKGRHSILSPSRVNWLNYDPDDSESFFRLYLSSYANQFGTAMHEYASNRIIQSAKTNRSLNLSKFNKSDVICHLLSSDIPNSVINAYIDDSYIACMNFVNDALRYKMRTEQPVQYKKAWGSADAISFENNFLRIHDLKTGKLPAHMEQLEDYAALFCLEYCHKPSDISIELRIYQGSQIIVSNPEPALIMDRIQITIAGEKHIDMFEEKDGIS